MYLALHNPENIAKSILSKRQTAYKFFAILIKCVQSSLSIYIYITYEDYKKYINYSRQIKEINGESIQ